MPQPGPQIIIDIQDVAYKWHSVIQDLQSIVENVDFNVKLDVRFVSGAPGMH